MADATRLDEQLLVTRDEFINNFKLTGSICELRPCEESMADDMVKVANNYRVWRNMLDFFPHPYERQHALMWIQANQVMPNKLLNFAICYNGVAVGSIGALNVGAEPNLRHCFKIGYFLGESYWGKGIATEAVKLMTSWLFSKSFAEVVNNGEFALRVEARVFSYNPSSARVLEKNGFHLETVTRLGYSKEGRYYDGLTYVLLNTAAFPSIEYVDEKREYNSKSASTTGNE